MDVKTRLEIKALREELNELKAIVDDLRSRDRANSRGRGKNGSRVSGGRQRNPAEQSNPT